MRPNSGLWRGPNLVVLILLFVVLGGYTFFLQQRLQSEESQISYPHQADLGGRKLIGATTYPQYEGTKLAEVVIRDQAALASRAQQLAREVAALADALQVNAQKMRGSGKAATIDQRLRDSLAILQANQKAEASVNAAAAVNTGSENHAGGRTAGDKQEVAKASVAQLLDTAYAKVERQHGDGAVAAGGGGDGGRAAAGGGGDDEKKKTQEPAPLEDDTAGLPLNEKFAKRAKRVRDAMKHSWAAYEKYAFGRDELMPRTQRGKNSFGGLGATVVDSLDTLHLMGLKEEYGRAREWVATQLQFDRPYDASVFETTIRIVGGMLAAYEFTGDDIYITKAQDLVERLLHAFDTPTGIPYNTLNLRSLVAKNPTWTLRASTLSEFGTEQLEFIKLSQATGNAVYAEKSEHVIHWLHEHYPDKGLVPIFLNPTTGKFTTQKVSLGAMGDSYYEYLLKVWILKGRGAADDMYREMWVKAMDEMIQDLVFSSSPSGLKYVAEVDNRGQPKHKMDHLACFIPAMLALGAATGAVGGEKGDKYMQLAKDLTYTCWQMYERQPTGLAPEYVNFVEGQDMQSGAHHNLLRPEAVEALFVLWRTTRDPQYREWGWQMFLAFEKWCKVETGYTGLMDVREVPPQHDDTMQSFWMAETLKYLFMLFSPLDVVPLDQFVLNTEAHPLRIMKPNGTVSVAQEAIMKLRQF